MKELTNIDFKILDFINKNQPVHIDKIKAEFPRISGVEYRIDLLSRQEFSQSGACYLTNSSYIIQEYQRTGEGSFADRLATGIYRITDLGRKTLQDYKQSSKSHRKELWLKNAWIPIIVAFATTVLTNYLLPKLPYLLELLFDILSKKS